MNALRYSTAVQSGGKVEVSLLDTPEGTPIEVLVLIPSDTDDPDPTMIAASESSLAFWDNPVDDEVWNTA